MIRRYCDRCDKEITNGYRADIYEYGYEPYGFKNDLCLDCAIAVQEFINPKRAERMKESSDLQDELKKLAKDIEHEVGIARSGKRG